MILENNHNNNTSNNSTELEQEICRLVFGFSGLTEEGLGLRKTLQNKNYDKYNTSTWYCH